MGVTPSPLSSLVADGEGPSAALGRFPFAPTISSCDSAFVVVSPASMCLSSTSATSIAPAATPSVSLVAPMMVPMSCRASTVSLGTPFSSTLLPSPEDDEEDEDEYSIASSKRYLVVALIVL